MTAQNALMRAAMDFATKPIDAKTLIARCQHWLNIAKNTRQAA